MALKDLQVNIKADTAGFAEGMQKMQSGMKETAAVATQMSRSLSSQAASIAAVYRKQGMNASDSMKKAWSEIERTTKSSSRGIKTQLQALGSQSNGIFAIGKSGGNFGRNIGNGLKNVSRGISSLAKAAISLVGISAGIAGIVQSMKAYAETRNAVQRVNELFRDSSKYLKAFASDTAKAFGMSESTAYQYAATYGNLFKGITRDTEENAKVTIAMMRASAVISSKTGRTMEDVNERIRSGILGNTEAIEDLGINVPVAMIKTTKAFEKIANGRPWEALTYQEQQQIRVLAILEQASSQYGDSVSQISGMSLPRLGQAFKDLVSYAGMFVTAGLQPIINALGQVVQWATAALKSLSAVLGLKLEGTLAAPANAGTTAQQGYEEATEDATTAAKKQKSTLAGFDELNVLANPDSGTSGTGSGGRSGGASPFADISMPELKGVEIDTSWADRFVKKIKDLFTPLQAIDFSKLNTSLERLWDAIRPFTKTVFAGLEWGYHNIFVPLAEFTIEELLPRFIDMLANAVEFAGKMIKEYGKFYKQYYDEFLAPIMKFAGHKLLDFLDRFGDRLKGLQDSISGSEVFQELRDVLDVVYPILKRFYEMQIAVQAFFIDFTVGQVFNTLEYWWSQLEDWIGVIVDLLNGDFTGAWEHVKNLFVNNPLQLIEDGFSNLGQSILGLLGLTDDFVGEIDVLGEGVSDTTKQKLKPFLDEVRKFDDLKIKIDYAGLKIDDEIVNQVSSQVHKIAESILNELSSDRNEALANLEPLREALGDETFDRIMNSTNSFYDGLETSVSGYETKINDIYARAASENRELTAAESAQVTAIRDSMNATGIRHMSESEVEYKAIMNRLKDNSTRVSLEQAGEIIQNAQKTRDDTVTAAEEQYVRQMDAAEQMRKVGAISEEEYQAMVDAAKTTKDDTIRDANAQYDNILSTTKNKLGENSRFIDLETGKMKTKWEILKEDVPRIVGGMWSKVTEKWDTFKEGLQKSWETFWRGLGNTFIRVWNGIIGGLETAINWIARSLNKISIKIPDLLGGGRIGFNVPTVSIARVPYLATGAVIPPRSEFLAVLGDQKSGRNIESPESLLRQIVREESGSKNDSGDIHITVYTTLEDGTIVGTTTKKISRANRMSGRPVLA